MRFYHVCICLLSAGPAQAQEQFGDRLRLIADSEARLDTDFALHHKQLSLLRPGLTVGIRGRNDKLRLLPPRFAVITRLRHWQQKLSDTDQSTSTELDAMELYGEWRSNVTTLTLGVQEIVWGETIGVPIIDLVNPRDLREPIFSDPADGRLPAPMARMDLQPVAALTVQIIGIPTPSQPRVPERVDGIIMDRPEPLYGSKNAEFGSRLGWLFESGLDLKLYTLRHHNRAAVYEPYMDHNMPRLRLIQNLIQTTGLGFSYAMQSIVWRGDLARHTEQPAYAASLQQVVKGTVIRAAVGVDWSGSNETLAAFQLSQDRYAPAFGSAVTQRRLTWATCKLSRAFFGRSIKLETLILRGMDHSDQWLQPKLIYSASGGFSAELRADLIDKAQNVGYFAPYRDADRIRLSLRYRL